MSKRKLHKLNDLLKSWPYGTVAASPWLKKRGVSRQLAGVYKKSSWIESLGHGAFIHAGDKVDWTGGLYALQEGLGLAVHAGGRTALQLQGETHFIPLGQGHPVFLFGLQPFLPAWFRRHRWGRPVHYFFTRAFPYAEERGLTTKNMGNFEIRLSSRELAILEALYLVGSKESYANAALLMEGLNTLRPALVQELLEKCSSIKVKRLFMHLAERFKHPWVEKVSVSKVDFGKGKRVIEEGGRFDAKYKISVPKIS